MQEATLEDEAQDAGAAHLLLLPTHGPVLKDVAGNVGGRVVGREGEVLRFATDQNETKVHRVGVSLTGHDCGQEWRSGQDVW